MSQFNYDKVKDPEFFRENRLDAHSDHVWYRDEAEEQRGTSSYRQSLNGLWKFSYALNYDSVIKGFEAVNYNCKNWADIRVPAHIQMEGYDVPQYANVQYPWDGRQEASPGTIPEDFNPAACYAKYFEVPEDWKGQPVYISFQGVESALALWCNGVYVGYSEDSFTPSEFELTSYLKEGENKLAAIVFKWSSSSWCEDQDFFRFSGIFRDVYLYTTPRVHIRDMKVQTLLNDTFDKAELTLDLCATGKGRVDVLLIQEERHYQPLEEYTAHPGQVVSRQVRAELSSVLEGRTFLSIPVDKPLLWSAEEPRLYRLLLRVLDEDGKVQEIIPQEVGFRRFELSDGLMKLNGKRIVFKGANRHEFSSRTGRVMNEQELWLDLVTMKRHNINAIRTCHYPNDSRIYNLCDRLGLYMIDECNLESHGSWAAAEGDLSKIVPGDHPEWNAMMLDRANSMYQRDKNHPAILIWSCGNEAYGGKNIYDMSQFFRTQDPGRVIHYEGICHDRRYPTTSDVESQMYPSAQDIADWLQNDRSKPFICCEYTHAMGNSCGAMHKYTDLSDSEPLYQGGFIWDYVDQSIYKKDRYGKEFQAYGGDFDERPCDYNFSGNGIVYGGDRAPSPKMQEVKYNYQNISVEVGETSITVHNKNLFVDTDRFDCVILVEKEGRRLYELPFKTCVKAGSSAQLPSPVTLPEENGEYTVTVSFRLKEDTPWASSGYEIAFGQGVFTKTQSPDSLSAKRFLADRPLAVAKPMQVIHGTYNLGVRGEDFDILFSYANAGMVSYRYGGKELFKTIPKPNFWRAPIDNDCGNDMMARYGQWKLASMYVTSHSVEDEKPAENENSVENKKPVVEEKDGCVSISYRYFLPTTPQAECNLSYRVYGDGTVAVTLKYDPVEGLGDMPEFGVMWKMDADYENLEWYGNGPEETYADRQRGAKLGLYKGKVSDGMARYLVPQECGNKTEVRYAKVTDAKGRGLLLAGDRMYFSALPYTPHELENAAHAFELPPVHYTVIRAALGQMGVGGDNSWGAKVHDEYLLPGDKALEFTFCFKGI